MSGSGWLDAVVAGGARLAARLRADASAWDRDVARRTLESFEAAHGLAPESPGPVSLAARLRPSGRPLVVHHGDARHGDDRARLASWIGRVAAADGLAVLWDDADARVPSGVPWVRAGLTRAEAEARLGHPGDVLPETVLLDADGGLLARHVGPLDAAVLDRFASLVGATS